MFLDRAMIEEVITEAEAGNFENVTETLYFATSDDFKIHYAEELDRLFRLAEGAPR